MSLALNGCYTLLGAHEIGGMPKTRRAIVPASAISTAAIERRIHVIRGQRVMLDNDLAELYGVETRAFDSGRRTESHPVPARFRLCAFQ